MDTLLLTAELNGIILRGRYLCSGGGILKPSVFLKPHAIWLRIIPNTAQLLIASGERLHLTAVDTGHLPEEAAQVLISVLRFSVRTVAVK